VEKKKKVKQRYEGAPGRDWKINDSAPSDRRSASAELR
jgi:hypothetical protein